MTTARTRPVTRSYCDAPNHIEPPPTNLIVKKVVASGDGSAPTDWSYDFSGLPNLPALTDEDPSTGELVVEPGTDLTVTEDDAKGAISTSVQCAGASQSQSAPDGRSVTLQVAEGNTATCTFTNTFRTPPCEENVDECPPIPCEQTEEGCPPVPCEQTEEGCPPVPCEQTEEGCPPVPCERTEQGCPPPPQCDPQTDPNGCQPPPPPPPEVQPEPATLTVVKKVIGEAATDAWSFPFTVTDLGGFDLTDSGSSFSDDVPAGKYTITETSAGDAGLISVDCGDEAVTPTISGADGGSVLVDLAEGEDVTCTFTNDFGAVEGVGVVLSPTPSPTPTPVVESKPVTRTLPRTGSESEGMALFGAGLFVLGSGLVLSSRRRLRRLL